MEKCRGRDSSPNHSARKTEGVINVVRTSMEGKISLSKIIDYKNCSSNKLKNVHSCCICMHKLLLYNLICFIYTFLFFCTLLDFCALRNCTNLLTGPSGLFRPIMMGQDWEPIHLPAKRPTVIQLHVFLAESIRYVQLSDLWLSHKK